MGARRPRCKCQAKRRCVASGETFGFGDSPVAGAGWCRLGRDQNDAAFRAAAEALHALVRQHYLYLCPLRLGRYEVGVVTQTLIDAIDNKESRVGGVTWRDRRRMDDVTVRCPMEMAAWPLYRPPELLFAGERWTRQPQLPARLSFA